MNRWILVGILLWAGCAGAPVKEEETEVVINDTRIKEGLDAISAHAQAPIPEEVENEDQKRSLARDAAVGLAQEQLLNYIMKKKTSSDKPLAEAEIPYIEIQQQVRALVKDAEVRSVNYKDGLCLVNVVVRKSDLKPILKKL